MLDRQSPFLLYCQITKSTLAGLVEAQPDDPEAIITVSVVAAHQEAQEKQVRNASGDLDTQVAVQKLSSVTYTGGRLLRRGGELQEQLWVSQSALRRIPKPGEGQFVEVTLPQGLRAVVDAGRDIPRIMVIDGTRRSR